MNNNKKLRLVILCSALILQAAASAADTSKPTATKPGTNDKAKSAAGKDSSSAAEVTEVDFGPYMANLQRLIKNHWFPPKNNNSLAAVVLFKIGKNGEVRDIRVSKSSGDAAADKAAIQAVATTPFAPLPPNSPAYVDIQFSFSYNVWDGHTLTRKAPTKEELERHITAAKNFVQAGKLYDALNEIEAVSNSNSPQIGTALEQIVAAGKSEKFNARMKLILSALKIAPFDDNLKQTLNAAFVDAGMDPKSAAAHVELAKVFQADQDYDSALAEYKRAYTLSGDQKYMDAVVRLAAMKDGEALLTKWKIALERSNTADNHAGLAYALEMCSDYDGAEAEYKKALELDPYYELAKVRLAAMPDKATRVSIPAPKTSITAPSTSSAGESMKVPAGGKRQAAILNNEGVTLLTKEKFESAILKFEAALRVSPDYSYAKDNLGIAYNNCALKSPPHKAIQLFRKSLWCTPQNPTTKENLDQCLRQIGLKPDQAPVRLKLAQQLEAEKNFQGAWVEYREALALTKDVAQRKKLEATIKETEIKINTP